MRSVIGAGVALGLGLALGGCGGGGKASKPEVVKPVSTIQAEALAGPFADVAGFCAQLGQPACEANEDVLMLMTTHKEPLTTRAGQKVKMAAAASRDRSAQYGHLLLNVDGKLWAVPPVLSYDPSGGRRVLASAMRFTQDEPESNADDVISVAITRTIENEPGGTAETVEFNLYCKVGPKPSCVRVNTGDTQMAGLNQLDPVKGVSSLVIPRQGGKVLEVRDTSAVQLGDKVDPTRSARMLAEGIHAVVYP